MFSYWMNGDQILNIKNLRNEGMVKDEVRNVYILSSPIVVLAQILMINFLYILYNVIPGARDRFNYYRIRQHYRLKNCQMCPRATQNVH